VSLQNYVKYGIINICNMGIICPIFAGTKIKTKREFKHDEKQQHLHRERST